MNYRLSLLVCLLPIPLLACGDKNANPSEGMLDGGVDAAGQDAGGVPDGDAVGEKGRALLEVDCLKRFTGVCRKPKDVDPGTYGKGVVVSGMEGSPTIGRGFIKNNEAFLPVEYRQNGDKSFVFKVDLETGDRTVISGDYEDLAMGTMTVGTGPSMVEVTELDAGSDGMIYALSTEPDVSVFRIDPSNGNRALVWTEDSPSYGQCTTQVLTFPDRVVAVGQSMAVDPDGSFYFSFDNSPLNSGYGIVKISKDGMSCEYVSRSGDPDIEDPDIGTGVEVTGKKGQLILKDDTIYALNRNSELMVAFEKDGSRSFVSKDGVGTGPRVGTTEFTWSDFDKKWWTVGTGGFDRGSLVSVDLATGDRVEQDYTGGPMKLGAQVRDEGPVLALENGLLLQVYDDTALVLVDPMSGDSNLFSY